VPNIGFGVGTTTARGLGLNYLPARDFRALQDAGGSAISQPTSQVTIMWTSAGVALHRRPPAGEPPTTAAEISHDRRTSLSYLGNSRSHPLCSGYDLCQVPAVLAERVPRRARCRRVLHRRPPAEKPPTTAARGDHLLGRVGHPRKTAAGMSRVDPAGRPR
jgi:hypothetical protein